MHIKQKQTIVRLSLPNNQIKMKKRPILVAPRKEFGNIALHTLWAQLYAAGLQSEFLRTLKIGHEGNKLSPKCDGYVAKIAYNKVAYQGSPLGASHFITYEEEMVENDNLKLGGIQDNIHETKQRIQKMNTPGRNTSPE